MDKELKTLLDISSLKDNINSPSTFKNEDIRGAKQTFVMGAGFAGYLGKGLACSIFHLKY